MRLRIELVPKEKNFSLPLSYNYYLASLIFYSLFLASPSFSRFLHEEGFEGMKFFTFSQLLIPDRKIEGDRICGSSFLSFFVSSPIPEILEKLVTGLYKQDELKIGEESFLLSSVEVVPEPEFKEEMKFSCLSPIVVSKGVLRGEKLRALYLTHEDPEFEEAVRQNLLHKYRVLLGKEPEDKRLSISFDSEYIERRKGKITKLLEYKGTKIRGVLAPFTARGSIELLKLGYDAGFGEKNSLGFGMVEAKE